MKTQSLSFFDGVQITAYIDDIENVWFSFKDVSKLLTYEESTINCFIWDSFSLSEKFNYIKEEDKLLSYSGFLTLIARLNIPKDSDIMGWLRNDYKAWRVGQLQER